MIDNIGSDIKKLLLASLGAVAMTSEKAKELIDDLVKKGEITLEQGKALNEELTRKVKSEMERAKSAPTADDVIKMLGKLSPKELIKLQQKLDGVMSEDDKASEGEKSN